MKKIKVRKVGNSLGVILPKSSGVVEGMELDYQKQSSKIELTINETEREYDCREIEKGFDDFEKQNILTEDEFAKKFQKYGWHK
ncbi:Hypothetical protein ADU73_0813 [Pediococcus damnosus]|uniref:AbrB/MazE/SpoVT family DNA-binding domain-containing protein n=1 Tax=Pediococcus damnosus TaxID=51663 RepID=UPI00078CCF7A|nr:hypothetical protein [Pediococcus damnosus]AMV69219.1 Hypothetical protein ADU73_0813 [Pediococcus damnosus]